MKFKWLVFVLLFLPLTQGAQVLQNGNGLLRNGPMAGYSEMREVMLWVQTTESADVFIEYWEKTAEKPVKFRTEIHHTEKAHAYTAHLVADQVEPGKKYSALLYINKKKIALPYPFEFQSQDLWQWRHDPPAFSFVTGSCLYVNDSVYDRPGKPYGGDYQIIGSMINEKPDLMVWLGDNTYLREADFNTITGIHYRYTHTRSLAALQPFLASCHHYAIWDDHDFGPNDANSSFYHKDLTAQAFKDFWANPGYGIDGEPGTTFQFSWADCDFFMLDNRYFRSFEDKTMLGEAQKKWLIEALRFSEAPFKFVCIGGMVLSTTPAYENYINDFPEERQELLDAIENNNIKGVIFLTGDRHHTELTKWVTKKGNAVFDLTISPITSAAYGGDKGANSLLVEGTEVSQRNYAVLSVSGPRTDRKLHIRVKDANGNNLWDEEIMASGARD